MVFKPSTKRASGFTLIEVMVAMAIVALALPALLIQVMTTIDGTAYMREKTIAYWVAQDTLTELRLERRVTGQLYPKKDKGELELVGRKWFWQLNTEKTQMDHIFRIDLEVSDTVDGDPLYSISGFYDDLP